MSKIPINIAFNNTSRVSYLSFYVFLRNFSQNQGRIKRFSYRKLKSQTGKSENTLRKYITTLIDLGWIFIKDGHLHFVSLNKIAKIEGASRRYKTEISKSNLTDIRNEIEEQVILTKLKQCQYIIDGKKAILNNSRRDYKAKKAMYRHCKKRGYGFEDFNEKLQISLKRLSQILDWSISKVSRILCRLCQSDHITKFSHSPKLVGKYLYQKLSHNQFIHKGYIYSALPNSYILHSNLFQRSKFGLD